MSNRYLISLGLPPYSQLDGVSQRYRKVVGKNVHATFQKGNMGYVQYTVPDTVAVEPTFFAFLCLALAEISLKNSELKTTHNTFRGCRVHFIRQPFSK